MLAAQTWRSTGEQGLLAVDVKTALHARWLVTCHVMLLRHAPR
jgi:hypothetical protein